MVIEYQNLAQVPPPLSLIHLLEVFPKNRFLRWRFFNFGIAVR